MPELSFEFFPPTSTEQNLRLWRTFERLSPLGPGFVSVTYGAGGTTRQRTFAAIQTILDRGRVPVAGHLTCVGTDKEATLDVVARYRALGVTSIVALRGDPPKDGAPVEQGFATATDLVAAIAKNFDMGITVAAYPETHPMAHSAEADLDELKRKQEAGATRAITQFFFDNADFLRFRDRARAAGITIPIVPGILPIEDFGRMTRFAGLCGSKIPDWMHRAYNHAETPEDEAILSTAICADQCQDLIAEGVEHLHFYTLNKPEITFDTCRALGFEPARFGLAVGSGAA